MRALRLAAGLLVAVVVHLVLVAIAPGVASVVDPLLLLIVLNAMGGNVVAAYTGGAAIGLTQDALTGGLFGLHGVAGTVVGFVAARAARVLTLQRGYYVALFFASGVLVQELVLQGLLLVMQERAELLSIRHLALRALIMGPAGALLVVGGERARESYGAWQARRPRRLSLE